MAFSYKKWETKEIIVSDGLVYYEYLPAMFIFQDITWEFTLNLPEDFDGTIWLEKDKNGNKHPKTTMGVAVMQTPFFLSALAISKLLGENSYGYSPIFQFSVVFSAIFYVLAGLFFLRKILVRIASQEAVLITITALGLATGLMFYGPLASGHSHAPSFFLVTLFIYLIMKWHEKPTYMNSIALGVTLGLITLVRPVNALVVIIAALYQADSKQAFSQKLKLIADSWVKTLLAIFCSITVVAVQCLFWKLSVDTWFIYSYGEEGFFWLDPKFLEGFFGFRKGLFVYSPILLIALIGFFLKHQKLKPMKLALIIYFVLNAYVILSWWCWWYGGSYTHRAFIDTLAVLAIFMCVVVERVIQSKKVSLKVGLAVFIGFCVYFNDFKIRQHLISFLHYDSMTWEAYKASFLTNKLDASYWELMDPPDYEAAKKGDR